MFLDKPGIILVVLVLLVIIIILVVRGEPLVDNILNLFQNGSLFILLWPVSNANAGQ